MHGGPLANTHKEQLCGAPLHGVSHALNNSDKHPAKTDGPPCPPPLQLNFPTTTPQADSKRRPIAAAAAQVWSNPDAPPPTASDIVLEYNIGRNDMEVIYMSPDPYHEAFKEVIDLRRFDFNRHRTAGLCLAHVNG